jgi:hypothetical protein
MKLSEIKFLAERLVAMKANKDDLNFVMKHEFRGFNVSVFAAHVQRLTGWNIIY